MLRKWNCIAAAVVCSGGVGSGVAQTAIADIPLDPSKQSVASLWVSEALLAVSDPAGAPLGPTGASRAYGILGTAMYDAWSAYEALPASTVLGDTLQRSASENTTANKREAISYAAYTVLSDLFTDSGLQQNFRDRMNALGYDPDTPGTTAAGIGVQMANSLMAFRQNDGSNQLNGYADTTGYTPVNTSSQAVVDIERWTPEFLPIGDSSGGQQSALQPHWGGVTPFAIPSGDAYRPPAPKPFLLDPLATADLANQTITRADGTTVAINKSLIGTDINPAFIQQAQDVVDFSKNLTDRQKLIAEFWEDPGGTPYPPGTWMFFGQKIGEANTPDLDDDVTRFFGLGNAVMDAGIATWEAKYVYDYARPVRVIRTLGELGLIGDEVNGEFFIEAWGGVGQGTQTILATDFLTYQTPDDNPSPPFPEYTSGHSAFSAAAAELLRLLTGSDDFVLGDGTTGLSVTFEEGDSRFEPGVTPGSELTLAWATFSAAADEAGESRLFGGIHFDDGDIFGRDLGFEVGGDVFERINFFLNGGVIPEPTMGTLVVAGSVLLGVGRRRRV
ncbi:MAG: vanadium-dependent haloperoxidase [Planctomycetota bacterium]